MASDPIRDPVRARFGEDPGVGSEGLDETAHAGLARLLDRRACRHYAQREVPEGLVRLLICAGLAAPTKSDLQQADVVWVRDPALRAKVTDGLPGADWIARAPVFLVICGNGARFAALFEGGEFPNDHFDALFNATVDAAVVLEGLVAAATVAGLCMGYAAGTAAISPRLDLGITVHEDRHDAEAFARLAPDYDARRMRDAPYRRQREPERFGEVQVYGWREDKRRQYAVPQRTDFGAFLRRKGFSFA